MEYPGSRFVKPIRLAMLLSFIAAFFIISPVVILYSAGYRFDFKNGLLKETGSLSVDILPKNATVYLDGLKIDQTIPIRLNNLTPHKYSLKLSAPGYFDWEKQIDINKNQTTYIKEMVLLKKSKPIQISKETTENIAISASGQYLAYTTTLNGKIAVKILDLLTSINQVAINDIGNSPVTLTWSPNGEYLLVSSANNPFDVFTIVNASSLGKIKNLAVTYPKEISKFIWSKDTEPKLYFSTKNTIMSYLPRLSQTSKISDNIFHDWYLDDGSLWTLSYNTTSDKLIIYNDTLGFKNIFASIPASEEISSSSLKSSNLEFSKKGTAIINIKEESRFLIVRTDKYFTVNGNNMLFSKYGNWLLIWTPSELWTYSEGDEPYLLNRSGEIMKKVEPLDAYNTLAMVWNKDVTALYPYFLTERIIIDDETLAIAASTEERILYFSNQEGLWKLNY